MKNYLAHPPCPQSVRALLRFVSHSPDAKRLPRLRRRGGAPVLLHHPVQSGTWPPGVLLPVRRISLSKAGRSCAVQIPFFSTATCLPTCSRCARAALRTCWRSFPRGRAFCCGCCKTAMTGGRRRCSALQQTCCRWMCSNLPSSRSASKLSRNPTPKRKRSSQGPPLQAAGQRLWNFSQAAQEKAVSKTACPAGAGSAIILKTTPQHGKAEKYGKSILERLHPPGARSPTMVSCGTMEKTEHHHRGLDRHRQLPTPDDLHLGAPPAATPMSSSNKAANLSSTSPQHPWCGRRTGAASNRAGRSISLKPAS